ncbi:MAG: DNA-3-methyladenine glycosylase [Cyanobacteria bacterium REEB65]|nr:DNA-3-methyladenine glycosylase [Cyanobacteria bacterium REEB65]
MEAKELAGDVRTVARRLLGMRLVRVEAGKVRSGFIVESEAYHETEAASHSHRGQTPRNRAMFGPPGTAYVYYIYGNSYCMNVACESTGVGAAVLLRALEPELGQELMIQARGRKDNLTSGPGRLCQALGIDRRLDGVDLLRDDRLYLAQGFEIREDHVFSTTRIGITKSAELPWRYLVSGNPHVSRPRPHGAR